MGSWGHWGSLGPPREAKGSKREPKRAPMEGKGSKREPKGGQNGDKMGPKVDLGSQWGPRVKKGSQEGPQGGSLAFFPRSRRRPGSQNIAKVL